MGVDGSWEHSFKQSKASLDNRCLLLATAVYDLPYLVPLLGIEPGAAYRAKIPYPTEQFLNLAQPPDCKRTIYQPERRDDTVERFLCFGEILANPS